MLNNLFLAAHITLTHHLRYIFAIVKMLALSTRIWLLYNFIILLVVLTSILVNTSKSDYVAKCKSYLDVNIIGDDFGSCDLVTQLRIVETPLFPNGLGQLMYSLLLFYHFYLPLCKNNH